MSEIAEPEQSAASIEGKVESAPLGTRLLPEGAAHFAHRMKVDLHDLFSEQHLGECRREIRTLVHAQWKRTNTSVDEFKLDAAIDQVFRAALTHQLADVKRDQAIRTFREQQKAYRHLVKQLGLFRAAVSKLDRSSRRKLDDLVSKSVVHGFDTESFDAIFKGAFQLNLSPAIHWDVARRMIHEGIRKEGVNGEPGKLIPNWQSHLKYKALADLWEVLPAETRTTVELALDRCPPDRILAFCDQLLAALHQCRPTLRHGNFPSVIQDYMHTVSIVWADLGLKVGSTPENNSPFQRFSQLPLALFGDKTPISRRQVRNAADDLA